MKIGNPAPAVHDQAPAAASGRGTAADVARPATADAIGSAKVELSPATTSLISSVKAAPADFDAGRVERISRSIADGSYQVDAGAIADKLIANAQEVLASSRQ